MEKQLVMPKLQPEMKSGVLCAWLKDEGDEIHKGDALYEIETGTRSSTRSRPRRTAFCAVSCARRATPSTRWPRSRSSKRSKGGRRNGTET